MLSDLYREVLIPPGVVAELQAKPDAALPEVERFLAMAHVRTPGNDALVRALSAELGAGEAAAIALAAEAPDALLIMDDADGRRLARGLGLRVTGLVGVLIEAKARGIIPVISPLLDQLMAEGLWVSEALRRVVLATAGE